MQSRPILQSPQITTRPTLNPKKHQEKRLKCVLVIHLEHEVLRVCLSCWWIAVIVDHFSRKAMGFAVFKKQPTSEEITAVLDKAAERTGQAPQHIISDKGNHFFCTNYKNWCIDNDVKPRFGVVGKHGSIAITERFIKSLKYECTKQISVPLYIDDMRHELVLYFIWYNQYRPHEYLEARTPEEVYNHSPPIEKNVLKHGSDIPPMDLELSFLDGREHLPVIEFKKAA